MTYTIHFTRSGGARFPMPADVADFYVPGVDAFFDLARQMTDGGIEDGSARFLDERGMPCFQVGSIYSMARRYRPTVAERAGEREYASWFPARRG